MEEQSQAIEHISKGTTVQSPRAETTSLMAAKAEAEAKARYVMALQRPRDEDVFRQKIMKACERPRFAEAALYEKPVGKDAQGQQKTVTGLSVRFAEQALQYYGNLWQSTHTILDDDEKRILHCAVVDLETNSGVGADIVIEKFVERRNPRKGDEVISGRQNSYGQMVYKVRANDDALLTKAQNLAAKLRRGLILQLIPADIKEEAVFKAQGTLRQEIKEDPQAARNRILDAFSGLGVSADRVKSYLELASLDSLQPAHLERLRKVWNAISSGEATWEDFERQKDAEAGDVSAQSGKDLAEKIRGQKSGKKKGSSKSGGSGAQGNLV